jgi:hypothetical protein|tara:strand:- start:5594 stop:5884 length:291 start_codon:yes stop_codon:yes gene_type:complete
MGFKSKLTSWVVGTAVNDLLGRLKVEKSKRKPVTKAVKDMLKPKNEPVLYGGIISVAVALGAAFGLDLTIEQLTITITTVIAIVTFVQRKLVSPKK